MLRHVAWWLWLSLGVLLIAPDGLQALAGVAILIGAWLLRGWRRG